MPTISPYDEISEWYEQSLQSGSPVHAVAIPALLELAGDVEGLIVCDPACGTGIAARELARRGAKVTGVDLSRPLLAIAEEKEALETLGICYRQGDAQNWEENPANTFDGIVCNLALMDIPDLNACLKTTARLLRPDGWFVFTITHPCFQMPDSRWTGKKGGVVKREVRGYFNEGYWRSNNPNGVRGQVGAYHRILSTVINALTEAGLVIEQMREPQPKGEIASRVPGYQEVPVVLAMRCRKNT
jgi:ubiquinone/menaquinone biosynthesis C-methylase UbiE